jgi:hypothetical protein
VRRVRPPQAPTEGSQEPRFQPLTGSWVTAPAVGGTGAPIVYPRLHALGDGTVFVSSKISGHTRNITYDPWSGAVREVCNFPDGDYLDFACPSVLLPLVPADGYRERVLLCGGTRSQFLDLRAGNPAWANVQRTGTAAGRPRFKSSATLLPTGDVLLTGGTVTADAAAQDGVMEPEQYNTPLDRANGAYIAGVGGWETINEPATVVRGYHSTALLMPDGRVWTAGSNSPTQPDTPPGDAQKKIEIYDPPYPAGPRPTIDAAPGFVGYGDVFTISTPQAAQTPDPDRDPDPVRLVHPRLQPRPARGSAAVHPQRRTHTDRDRPAQRASLPTRLLHAVHRRHPGPALPVRAVRPRRRPPVDVHRPQRHLAARGTGPAVRRQPGLDSRGPLRRPRRLRRR